MVYHIWGKRKLKTNKEKHRRSFYKFGNIKVKHSPSIKIEQAEFRFERS
jgi:hypothetical protein